MCALDKVLTSLLFAFLFLIQPAFLEAQPPSGDPFQRLTDKVQSIDERVKHIEASQKEILERQQKILEEIANLRVWIRQS